MYSEIIIRDARDSGYLVLAPLERLNILVEKNGSGRTSTLKEVAKGTNTAFFPNDIVSGRWMYLPPDIKEMDVRLEVAFDWLNTQGWHDVGAVLELIYPNLMSGYDSPEDAVKRLFAGEASSSAYRLACLVVALIKSRNGLLLIDDMDACLPDGVLFDFWQQIHKLLIYYNVQLIATTHNLDCLEELINLRLILPLLYTYTG